MVGDSLVGRIILPRSPEPTAKRLKVDDGERSSLTAPMVDLECSSPLLLAPTDSQSPFWFSVGEHDSSSRKRPRDDSFFAPPTAPPLEYPAAPAVDSFSGVMEQQQNLYCDMVQQMMQAQFSPGQNQAVDWAKEWQVQLQNVMNAQLTVIKQFQEQLSSSFHVSVPAVASESIFIDDDDDDCSE